LKRENKITKAMIHMDMVQPNGLSS